MSKEDENGDKQPEREEQDPTASYDSPICGPGTEIRQYPVETKSP
jgi:hypothetical protein